MFPEDVPCFELWFRKRQSLKKGCLINNIGEMVIFSMGGIWGIYCLMGFNILCDMVVVVLNKYSLKIISELFYNS